MNRVRPQALAALTAVCVLVVIPLGTGCSAAAPGGSSVLAAGSSPDRTSTGQPGQTADSGIAGCTALLRAHQAAAADYPRIRSQFARSRWPDVRTAGMSYVDLVVQLQTARADGYETVWFYQRLSLACAKHGWKSRPRPRRTRLNEAIQAAGPWRLVLPGAEDHNDLPIHQEAAMTTDDE